MVLSDGFFPLRRGLWYIQIQPNGKEGLWATGFPTMWPRVNTWAENKFPLQFVIFRKLFQPQPLCHPALLTSFLFSAYLDWLLGPLLSLSTGVRGSNIVGKQTWASTCFYLLCEFWHIVLLLNFWGLYYIMLCYIVLCYNLLGVIMKVNEIMHVRFLARFLACGKHQEIIYILSMQPSWTQRLLSLLPSCSAIILFFLKCYLWSTFPRNFCQRRPHC